MEERLLRAAEVAAILGCHVETVRRLGREGRLARIVLTSRALRFRPEDVEAFIARLREGEDL